MFSDGVPETWLGKDSTLDSCPACSAANTKSRNRCDGETWTATEPGQGLSLDFLFAGQHSKNATNPEQMRINDYMGVHGETCYLLLYDHATEKTGRSMLTVECATYGLAEEVAHEERERRCERSVRLHGSGRRIIQIQSM